MRRLWPWLCLLVVGTALAAEPAAPLFHDDFSSNAKQWRLDEAWKFGDGELLVHGPVGQVAVVGHIAPVITDFRATVKCRWIDGVLTSSYGFIYRFNAQAGNGYFMCCSPSGAYGFGRVQGGEFELKARGRDPQLMLGGPRTLVVEVKGDLHKLSYNGKDLDTWRDGELTSGGFGLVTIDAAQVGFDELTIDSLAEPTTTPPAPAPGPGPTAPGPIGIGPSPRPGGTPLVRLDMVDLDRLRAWRRRFNQTAAAVGDTPLAGEADAVDLAVTAWLRLRQAAGACPPASWLSALLAEKVMTESGSAGPAPLAAVTFALAAAGLPPAGPSETLSSSEDLLGALTWYFTQRSRSTAAWGNRPTAPWAPDERMAGLLAADLAQAGQRLPLAARQADWEQLAAKVRLLAPNLKPKDATTAR